MIAALSYSGTFPDLIALILCHYDELSKSAYLVEMFWWLGALFALALRKLLLLSLPFLDAGLDVDLKTVGSVLTAATKQSVYW